METEAERTILALERAALERWGQGDPDGFLEISAPDVSYFDPFENRRLDSLDSLRSLYETIRGQVHIDSFEIIEPRVQVLGDCAILTFRFLSHGSEGSMHWNTTEVYRQTDQGWRIVHTHWAFHLPKLAAQQKPPSRTLGFYFAVTYLLIVVGVFALTAATTKPGNAGLDWIPFWMLAWPWVRWDEDLFFDGLIWNTALMYVLGRLLQPFLRRPNQSSSAPPSRWP